MSWMALRPSSHFPQKPHDSPSWNLIVAVDVSRLPGLEKVRSLLTRLPLVPHPDHHLHVTLRYLGEAHCVKEQTLLGIKNIIAATPRWTARVQNLHTFSTVVWADPDLTGKFADLTRRLLGPVGELPPDPRRHELVSHLTLGYANGYASQEEVQEALAPIAHIKLGTIEVEEVILTELSLDASCSQWKIIRHFPLQENREHTKELTDAKTAGKSGKKRHVAQSEA